MLLFTVQNNAVLCCLALSSLLPFTGGPVFDLFLALLLFILPFSSLPLIFFPSNLSLLVRSRCSFWVARCPPVYLTLTLLCLLPQTSFRCLLFSTPPTLSSPHPPPSSYFPSDIVLEKTFSVYTPPSLCQVLPRKVKVKSLSCVRLFATPWTVAHHAPPSMGFFQTGVLEWGAIAFSMNRPPNAVGSIDSAARRVT